MSDDPMRHYRTPESVARDASAEDGGSVITITYKEGGKCVIQTPYPVLWIDPQTH